MSTIPLKSQQRSETRLPREGTREGAVALSRAGGSVLSHPYTTLPHPTSTPGGPEAARAPAVFLMTRTPPTWFILPLCMPQPSKTPAASANVPKQTFPRDLDNSPIILGQSQACSLLGARIQRRFLFFRRVAQGPESRCEGN